ncbi:MAG: hypothetical protein BGO01_04735 [Armatimonadetes bacterium 55-13]|nr:MAG: hypothetical protein BGO01_04735 [Armatimonadetes bacterium 55-13]
MKSKTKSRKVILSEAFKAKVEEFRRIIDQDINNYSYKNKIVSSLDGAICKTWSKDTSLVKVTERNRFPNVNGYTPDFMFGFSNGYHVICEFKTMWRPDGESDNDLVQLSSYKRLCSAEVEDKVGLVPTRKGDVMLIVAGSNDEAACESIANCSHLGPGSVVVTEAHYEGQAVNGEYIKFTYRKFGGQNGQFGEINAGEPGTEFDLNHWFVEKRGFSPKCDRESLLESGECPFVNDTPPPVYTIIEVIMPIINSLLDESHRDDIAMGNNISIQFSEEDIAKKAVSKYPRVPNEKLRSWIKKGLIVLKNLGVVRLAQRGGLPTYEIYLDDSGARLSRLKLVDRLAKGRATEEFTPVSLNHVSDQYSFDFDAMGI